MTGAVFFVCSQGIESSICDGSRYFRTAFFCRINFSAVQYITWNMMTAVPETRQHLIAFELYGGPPSSWENGRPLRANLQDQVSERIRLWSPESPPHAPSSPLLFNNRSLTTENFAPNTLYLSPSI